MKYEEVKADYWYMTNTYGQANDLAGGFVIDEAAFALLNNPCKKKAKEIFISLIRYGFQQGEYIWNRDSGANLGVCIDISNNERAVEIYDKYC